ncbi:D-aminoacyl-tRNA deacylase, partial [Neisseria weixii]
LYQRTAEYLREHGLTVETGRFQTHMQVTLCNDGPVTLLLDSQKLF